MWTYWLHFFLIVFTVLADTAAVFCLWGPHVRIFRFFKRAMSQFWDLILCRKIYRSSRTSVNKVFSYMLKQEISPIEPFILSSFLWFSSPSNANLDKGGNFVMQLVPENQALVPNAAENQKSAAIDRLFRHKKAFFQNCEYERTIARAFTRKTEFKEITADEGQTTRSSYSHCRPSAVQCSGETVGQTNDGRKSVDVSKGNDACDLPIEMNEVDSKDNNVQETQTEKAQIERTQSG